MFLKAQCSFYHSGRTCQEALMTSQATSLLAISNTLCSGFKVSTGSLELVPGTVLRMDDSAQEQGSGLVLAETHPGARWEPSAEVGGG